MNRTEHQQLAEAVLKYGSGMLQAVARVEKQKPKSREQWLATAKRLISRGVIVWRLDSDGQPDGISFDLTRVRGTIRMEDLPQKDQQGDQP